MGNIYLAKQESGDEFTQEDEETLVMFASQAALVIANASRHRSEQQARANLETLIDTSPVGVAVFDARTGAPISFNREAARIVGALQTPGRPPEQLLEVLTFRRADGREISLDESPMAQALNTGETVRAEEIVIQVPDGRSVTTLINATPIYSEGGGELESVVVTLQDMTPLEEMERLRAELLGVVSHELRTPLAAIRGSATTMLDDESALDPAEMRQFHRIIVEQADRMRALISDLLDVARIETGTLSVSPETTTIAAFAAEISEFLKTSELAETRSFVRSFVKEVVVKPGKAAIVYSILTPEDSPWAAWPEGGCPRRCWRWVPSGVVSCNLFGTQFIQREDPGCFTTTGPVEGGTN